MNKLAKLDLGMLYACLIYRSCVYNIFIGTDVQYINLFLSLKLCCILKIWQFCSPLSSINTCIGIHITCTTDTAQTLTHPTLVNNIFTSTLGIKCALPVSYARQHQLSHTFPITLSTVGAKFGALPLTLPPIYTLYLLLPAFGLRFGLLFGYLGHCFGIRSLWLLAKLRSYTHDDRLPFLLPLLFCCRLPRRRRWTLLLVAAITSVPKR